ncbi:hypothetical protein LMH87_003852 [Akanthomyces muscarius]|uniref:Uncharacterized protein n=1 Tax=Akanthomyces muscarius TaxID=2231603 RepID=A0A9W8UF33_AKAMU|nr:hypothetical protein LMH87_003852 [Akanthomyces muscarius]KAJ4144987.1 hypothetical protein LMH87_003852 [Akanthomyces muscarius]
MKLSFTLPFLITPALCAGGNRGDTQIPDSVPASAVLATITALPSSVSGKQYTSLASALYSVEKSFYNDKQYTAVAGHMWSAAARASDSEKVVPSLALSTWSWDDITSAAWYDKNMPKDDKKYVSSYMSSWSEQYEKFVSGGSKGKGGDDKKGNAVGGNAAQHLAVVWTAAALAGVAGFVAVL